MPEGKTLEQNNNEIRLPDDPDRVAKLREQLVEYEANIPEDTAERYENSFKIEILAQLLGKGVVSLSVLEQKYASDDMKLRKIREVFEVIGRLVEAGDDSQEAIEG